MTPLESPAAETLRPSFSSSVDASSQAVRSVACGSMISNAFSLLSDHWVVGISPPCFWAWAALHTHIHVVSQRVSFPVTPHGKIRTIHRRSGLIGGEFEGNDSRLLIVTKNDSIWYILPMFGFVCKNLHFLKQTVEIANLSLYRFAWGPTGTQNQNMRPIQTRFDTTNPMAVSES